MKQRGFTVIELLVVIALIGLLASIVLVSFNLPEKRYRATVAKSLDFSQSIQNAIGIDAAGWWNFDDDVSDGQVTDTSGNSNTGQLCDSTGCGAGKGPSQTDDTPHKVAGTGGGKFALNFDGVGDNVSISNPIRLSTQFTISHWLKTTASGSQTYTVGNAGAGNGYRFGIGGGKIAFLVGNASGYTESICGATKVNDDKWHLITGVFVSGDKFTCYIDAKLEATVAVVDFSGMSTAAPGIGAPPCCTDYAGLIDEVRIYSQALTAQQVQQHYVEGLARHKLLATK